MRNKKLLWALAPLALAACTQDEIVPDVPVEGNAVTFSASADRQSRAGSTVNSTFDAKKNDWGIGLYGFYTGQQDWASASIEKPDFMKDQLVTYNGTGWEYTPVKYWPNTTGDKLSFIAYYPKLITTGGHPSTSAAVSTADDATKGLPEVTVDITNGSGAITTASMLDFVVAESGTFDKQKSGGTVALGFTHAMSRVNISARQDNLDANTYVYVEAVNIKSTAESNLYKSGVYYWTKTGAGVTGAWKVTDDDKYGAGTDITLSGILATASETWGNYSGTAVKLDQGGAATGLLTSGEYLFFIPTGEESLGATAEITYAVATKDTKLDDGGYHSTTTVEVPLDELNLEKGKAYNLCFTIGLSEVKVSATVEDWDSETQVLLPTQTVSLTAGDTNANTTAIANAWAVHAATKGTAGNNDHFVIKCTGEGVTAADIQGLNFSSATITDIDNFIYGDRIELQLIGSDGLEQDLTDVTVTLPEGWVLKEVGNSNSGKNLLFERSVSPTPSLQSQPLEAANCYMINSEKFESGIYIPLSQAKRGYDIAASASSSSALTLSTDGFSVEEAAVGGGSNPDVIDDGSCRIVQEGSEYYLYVKFKGSFTHTNTVLRLKQGSTVVWSWHLWLTNYVPQTDGTADNGDVIPYTISSTTRYCMDRNLGAVCSVDHVVTSNDAPTTGDATDYYGLYYQFGRKDPFYGDANGARTAYHYDQVSVLDAIKNPGIFYATCPNWSTDASTAIWDDSGSKTVFDPCPPGWRIRPNGENLWDGDGFKTGNNSIDWHSNGHTFYENSSTGPFTWFPAASYLEWAGGNFVSDYSLTGNYWSASYDEGNGYYLNFSISYFDASDDKYRANGYSVRCVQE